MKNDNEPPNLEQLVARVTVIVTSEFLPPVVDFVRQRAHWLGLSDDVAEHLDRAVEVVCLNVAEHAFESEEGGSYDGCILCRPGQVVIAVEDRGLPGDYDCKEE